MNKILKQNEYKCVRLKQNTHGELFVSKSYSNQGKEQDIENTRYIDQALRFFYENFSDKVRVPRPISVDLDACEISMEYLPNLPTAKRLRLSELSIATPFFRACYQHRGDSGFLRGIDTSVIMTPGLKRMLEQGFPLSLGFKGDLSENLVIGDGELILADIDSICLEPLGLSELILYADQLASSKLYPAIRASLLPPRKPVAFEFIKPDQAEMLINATIEVLNNRMGDTSTLIKIIKLRTAKALLTQLLSTPSA